MGVAASTCDEDRWLSLNCGSCPETNSDATGSDNNAKIHIGSNLSSLVQPSWVILEKFQHAWTGPTGTTYADARAVSAQKV